MENVRRVYKKMPDSRLFPAGLQPVNQFLQVAGFEAGHYKNFLHIALGAGLEFVAAGNGYGHFYF